MAMVTYKFSETDVNRLSDIQTGSLSFGPLTLSWNLDISIPRAIVDATLLGVSIGHAVIDKDNPSIKMGGSVGIATASVEINADFAKKELDYKVDVEILGGGIHKSGKLFSW